MSIKIEKQLADLGLTKNEQKIYLFLLSFGEASPSVIARETSIARTNLYYVLDLLMEKGLVRPQTKPDQKRKNYIAEDPSLLLTMHDQKREQISKLLPDISALYERRPNKPTIQFFEGIKEIKKIYLQTLSSQSIYAMGSTKELSTRMPKFYKEYFQSLKKKGIVMKDILSYPSKDYAAPEARKALKALYDVWVIPKKYGDFPTDILVWNDNVAIISLGKPLFGTVITHKEIADTFRIVMDVLHEKLERG
ncbi:hypothetical protein HON52_02795 [Candidatus Uhrbacteria bacterium]|jgi:sugar-specific transcriptional regulator TrmB|nr:hypothetical protein [Candidatus Uhrbacteria bacterium]